VAEILRKLKNTEFKNKPEAKILKRIYKFCVENL